MGTNNVETQMNVGQAVPNKEQKQPKKKSGGRNFIELIAGLIVARAFIVLVLAFLGGRINIIEVPIWIIAIIVAYKLDMFKLAGTFGMGNKK